ncbi:hypothetical protein K466DRAFT_658637 [Polyporus arcularius HHB13444]|uniref:Uncharacterized protein n=1 Tax=Polyporus arcularius HHB13444 TaxID=1314778 RepID=A0A5C3PYY0_9APHY|nr:hypothetical protein K466DRAFT_658637 [Polyporus arcularius HHB13444]
MFASFPDADSTMAFVAPQPQRPISLTEGFKDSLVPALLHAQQPYDPALSVPTNSTSSPSSAEILSPPPDALQPVRGVWSRQEVVMLSVHGLAQFDLLDDVTWETAAFDLWLIDRTQNPVTTTDAHRNKLAPLAIRALGPATQQGMPWQFGWTSLFRAYTIITDRAVQLSTMEAIVDVEADWVQDGGLALLGLAWMCVERVVEGDEVVRESVARLATNLFKIFATRRMLYANVFGELLKRCIWGEFEAWWGQDAGLSSGLFKGNPAALSAAYGIVQFIGDLYQRCMLPASFVQRALRTLVGAGGSGSMVAIEQLRALRLLLSYVRDSRLRRVDPDGMVQIMAAFSVSWARVNTSWMGEPFERNELKMHFQFVNSIVMFWNTLPNQLPEMFTARPPPTLPRTPLLASSPTFVPSAVFLSTHSSTLSLAPIVGLPEVLLVQG